MRPNVVTEGFYIDPFPCLVAACFLQHGGVGSSGFSSELERLMGSVRLLYIILLLATSNAILHLLAALLITHNPFLSLQLMQECTIGFSGVLFSLIVIETNLSGVQSRSAFGLFNVPAYMYVWILLLVVQVFMSNVSFLGHLCGILSGFAYTYGFNFLIPGPSFFTAIEASPVLTQVEVAISAAADGDLDIAVEILTSQQG